MPAFIRKILCTNTLTFIVAVFCIALLSVAFAFARKVAFRHEAHACESIFEVLGISLFIASYVLNWSLLFIGLVRPASKFTFRGGASRRAVNFFCALGVLLLLHVWIAFSVATAGH